MMKLIRALLGSIILFLDRMTSPTPLSRTPEEQKRVDAETRGWVLYQFEACPFCVKVRRGLKRLNLKVEIRDVKKEPRFADELIQGGGELQVPCLRIPAKEGADRWMYESSDILTFLEKQFS